MRYGSEKKDNKMASPFSDFRYSAPALVALSSIFISLREAQARSKAC